MTMQKLADHIIAVAQQNEKSINKYKLEKVMYFVLKTANENNLITITENKVPNSTITIQVSKADPYDKMEKFDSLKTRLASYGVTLVKV